QEKGTRQNCCSHQVRLKTHLYYIASVVMKKRRSD
ncbi:MAG: hypothetical protein ACI90V_009728, partial [Bacillariaceae sp.]